LIVTAHARQSRRRPDRRLRHRREDPEADVRNRTGRSASTPDSARRRITAGRPPPGRRGVRPSRDHAPTAWVVMSGIELPHGVRADSTTPARLIADPPGRYISGGAPRVQRSTCPRSPETFEQLPHPLVSFPDDGARRSYLLDARRGGHDQLGRPGLLRRVHRRNYVGIAAALALNRPASSIRLAANAISGSFASRGAQARAPGRAGEGGCRSE